MEEEKSQEKKEFPLKEEDIKKRLKELRGWKITSDKKKIFREVRFKSFYEVANFLTKIANFSEKNKHYPDILIIRHLRVKIGLTTPKVGGISEKDLALAEEINHTSDWKIEVDRYLSSTKLIIILLILFLIVLWLRYFN